MNFEINQLVFVNSPSGEFIGKITGISSSLSPDSFCLTLECPITKKIKNVSSVYCMVLNDNLLEDIKSIEIANIQIKYNEYKRVLKQSIKSN